MVGDGGHFNPRAPCGARLRGAGRAAEIKPFQSTRPLRGATVRDRIHAWCGEISIHAPLAGRDFSSASGYCPRPYFNPRAPCGARPFLAAVASPSSYFNPRAPCGARPGISRTLQPRARFQSTRPLRGATVADLAFRHGPIHFNPRAPCGARRRRAVKLAVKEPDFNPRTPCGVRLARLDFLAVHTGYFNPRTPCGVRRFHALTFGRSYYFNPRTPCGVRRRMAYRRRRQTPFQSTHPLRGATSC